MSGWNVDIAAGSAGPGAVTLLEGSSFCISAANGDMHAGSPQGAFFNDTRFIAEWNLTINGRPIEGALRCDARSAPSPIHRSGRQRGARGEPVAG